MAATQSGSADTSRCRCIARPPSARIFSATAAASPPSTSAMTTVAPSRANVSAVARPIPPAAPVMRAILSGSRMAVPSSGQRVGGRLLRRGAGPPALDRHGEDADGGGDEQVQEHLAVAQARGDEHGARGGAADGAEPRDAGGPAGPGGADRGGGECGRQDREAGAVADW